jgi:chaperonin GroEL
LQEKDKSPFITKDGVTVARFVHLEDPFENAAAQIIKQASIETSTHAGDGTTTATVLANSCLQHASKYLAAGSSAVELKRGMDLAAKAAVVHLKEIATPVTTITDVERVAAISANNDRFIGKLIAMAVDKVGNDGSITIEESRTMETHVDIMEGFKLDSGYRAAAFVTDERRATMNYNNPLILVTDYKVEMVEEILPVLELIARESRPLVLVADDVDGQALAALIMNTMRGTLKVAAIKAPRYGQERRDLLSDLALSTGSTLISRASGMKLKEVKLSDLGTCNSIESTKLTTTIIGAQANHEELETRISALKAEMEETDSLQTCKAIQERITRLASGVGVIHVGAPTQVEMIEKKHRIEDALEAVKSAQVDGIVAGGGTALLHTAAAIRGTLTPENEDQGYGIEVVLRAMLSPIQQMAANSGNSSDLIIAEIERSAPGIGYDFRNQKYVDMQKTGIIDPVKVTTTALTNAVSAAGTLLTTNFAIIQS